MSPPTNQHHIFTGQMPFLLPNQQCHSTELKYWHEVTGWRTSICTAVERLHPTFRRQPQSGRLQTGCLEGVPKWSLQSVIMLLRRRPTDQALRAVRCPTQRLLAASLNHQHDHSKMLTYLQSWSNFNFHYGWLHAPQTFPWLSVTFITVHICCCFASDLQE